MSFGFGIGDAIFVAEVIVKTYKLYTDSPEEILQIGKNAESTKDRLTDLGKTVGQPDSLIHSKETKKIKHRLKLTMVELQNDLTSIKDMIEEWNILCKGGIKTAPQRAWFTMVDARKLKVLDLKLKGHDSLIDSILQRLQSAADDKMIKQNEKLQEQNEKLQEQQRETIKKIDRQTREWRKWAEVVKAHGTEAVSQAATSHDAQPWMRIKEDLMKKGLSEDVAETMLAPIKAELNELQAPQPMPAQLLTPVPDTKESKSTSPSPVKFPIRPTTPNDQKGQNLKPSPAPPQSPSPKPNSPASWSAMSMKVTIPARAKAKAQVIDVNNSRILFVDDSNRNRSIAAHAYFELARIWTINTTNRWLFEVADSAGIYIETPFTKRHAAKLKYGLAPDKFKRAAPDPNNEAFKALIDQNTFRSNEREAIKHRFWERKTQGIRAGHFYDWDYIICFGGETRDALHTLQACAVAEHKDASKLLKAKILHLPGAPYTLEGQEMVNAVKGAIKKWLKDELEWVEPNPTLDLRWSLRRTYQVITTEEHFRTMMGEDWSQGFWKIRKECAVFIACTPTSWENTRLISCCGKREEIDKAWAMLKDKGIVEIARD